MMERRRKRELGGVGEGGSLTSVLTESVQKECGSLEREDELMVSLIGFEENFRS